MSEAVVDFLYCSLAEDLYRVRKPVQFQLEGHRSARRGAYRVIYSIHELEVLLRVVRISHRAHSYR